MLPAFIIVAVDGHRTCSPYSGLSSWAVAGHRRRLVAIVSSFATAVTMMGKWVGLSTVNWVVNGVMKVGVTYIVRSYRLL